jgi:hypothetical protein
MKPKPDPSQEELLQNFRYDPEIGALYWIGTRRKGRLAGSITDHGYWVIALDGTHDSPKQYKAHRLIWIYHFGTIPDGFQVDHKNAIRSDNHIENLQLATPLGNSQNQSRHKNNTSGVRGVYFVPGRKCGWWYQRQFNKRKIVRAFQSKSQAVAYALKMERIVQQFGTRPILEMEQNHGVG